MKQLREFLSYGKDASGKPIDVKNFDKHSRKSLKELLREIKKGECSLVLNKRTGRIIRNARSVKVLITVKPIRDVGYFFLETKREYQNNGQADRALKEWTVSETLRRGERLRDGACRCLWHEVKIRAKPWQIRPEFWHGLEVEERESRAFWNLRSRTVLQRVELQLWTLPWKQIVKTFEDGKVRIHIKRFSRN